MSNLLDMSDYPYGTFIVSVAAFLLAYTAVCTANLTLTYGADRFPDGHAFPSGQKRPLWLFLAGTASAATLIVCVVLRTESEKGIQIIWALLGFAIALFLICVSKVVQLRATDPKTTPHPPPYLIFPVYKIRAFEKRLDRIYCQYPERVKAAKIRINRLSQWPLEILRPAGQGYLVDLSVPPGKLKLRSGHVFALALSVMTFLVYLAMGFGKRFVTAEQASIPALAFVLLFFTVCCWAWAALTFFFDRYRFPLLWTMLALSAITASAPESDHFFRVESNYQRTANLLTPAQYLRARVDEARKAGRKPSLIFVATPGGGMQAGAWTAQVLDNLDTKLNIPGDPSSFRSSVCFISSVSGGSLGSLAYAAKLAGLIDNPAETSQRSAIDEVAWGWTQPDFWRTLLPWLGKREVDRGWALEEKWIDVNHLGPKRKGFWSTLFTGPPKGRDVYLDDWAAKRAALPALVFNSMLVEPGRHVVFSTTDYPPKNDPRGIVNFYSLYPERGRNFDVRVATAARLSASFPYVAPASRPSLDPHAPAFHFVDGGYYDNYGIDSLIGWLSEALADKDVDRDIGDVLVLEIRHFNSAMDNSGHRKAGAINSPLPFSCSRCGMLHRFRRDRNELDLFAKTFSDASLHDLGTKRKRKLFRATVPFFRPRASARRYRGNLARANSNVLRTPGRGYQTRTCNPSGTTLRGRTTNDR